MQAIVSAGFVLMLILGGIYLMGRIAYLMAGESVVRCADGHVFTTRLSPFPSFVAIRISFTREYYCPVGDHWTTATPV